MHAYCWPVSVACITSKWVFRITWAYCGQLCSSNVHHYACYKDLNIFSDNKVTSIRIANGVRGNKGSQPCGHSYYHLVQSPKWVKNIRFGTWLLRIVIVWKNKTFPDLKALTIVIISRHVSHGIYRKQQSRCMSGLALGNVEKLVRFWYFKVCWHE